MKNLHFNQHPDLQSQAETSLLFTEEKNLHSFLETLKNYKSVINVHSDKIKKLVLMLFVLVSVSSFAQNDAKRVLQFNLENKVAIQGYDPVAYFKQNKAIKGKNDFTASYMGVVYKFSSAVNKDLFLKNPVAYEPQYGGWCAYAMGSSAKKVEINPETFKITDGKLYLFYNAFFNNTLKSWNQDEANLKAKADVNWKKIYK